MPKVLVIGSLNYDLVSVVKRLPKSGETIHSINYYENPGGKGANQAVAAARLGAAVHFIGKVGQDEHGDILLSSLKNNQINAETIRREGSTGKAFITVDQAGNNHITLMQGANYLITKEDIDQSMELFKESDIILLQLEIPLDVVAYAINVAHSLNKYIILNPAPSAKLDDEIFKKISLMVPNETELQELTGLQLHSIEEIETAANTLLDKGIKDVVVTLGSKGSLYISKHKTKKIEAFKTNVVDTTAAGDTYIGALAVELAKGRSMEDAMKFASAASAICVSKKGAMPSIPRLTEVEIFLE